MPTPIRRTRSMPPWESDVTENNQSSSNLGATALPGRLVKPEREFGERVNPPVSLLPNPARQDSQVPHQANLQRTGQNHMAVGMTSTKS